MLRQIRVENIFSDVAFLLTEKRRKKIAINISVCEKGKRIDKFRLGGRFSPSSPSPPSLIVCVDISCVFCSLPKPETLFRWLYFHINYISTVFTALHSHCSRHRRIKLIVRNLLRETRAVNWLGLVEDSCRSSSCISQYFPKTLSSR